MNSSPPDNEMSSHRLNEINMTKDADRDAELAKNATNVNLYEHDSAMDGLSLLEQKSVLIERALNETGFGKYQWAIFFLCGFGYCLDLMWAQAFGLILAPLALELNVPLERQGDIFTAFSTGLCVGAFTWGLLVDIIGRKWAFNLTCLITALFGLVIGAPNSYAAICVLTAFCGFGLGGNIPIDATILLEFVPVTRRWLIVVLSGFQPLGVIICSCLAFGLVPPFSCDLSLPSCPTVAAGEACCSKGSNMGWRYLMYTLGAITLGVFFLRFVVFSFRESPKFLLTRGRDQDAIDVVQSIAKFNGTTTSLSIDSFYNLARIQSPTDSNRSSDRASTPDAESGPQDPLANVLAERKKAYNMTHLKQLFITKKMAAITCLLFLVYMSDYWAFTVAGSFLPRILADKGAARSIPLSETYRNYIIVAVCGLPGVAFGAWITTVKYVGNKWSMVGSAILMGVSLCLYAVVNSQAANVAFQSLEYCFQSLFNAILYAYAPQLFVTAVRGTAVGCASTLGRLVSIVAPLIAANLYAGSGSNGVLYLGAGGAFVAGIASVFLPETRGKLLY